MTYSNARYMRDNEFDFPPPPLWLLWIGGYDKTGEGVLRHYASLDAAKRYIGQYASGRWQSGTWPIAWDLYEWTGKKYVKRYGAESGDKKEDHPLFQKRLRKGTGAAKREVAAEEVEAALASIMEVMQ